ncbi:hypothetical protein LAZ67_13001551 [Cordylochernes scorpioides]|uniref:Uncharacterized protein n=1 Tax=Cordylochernes scorpioides TaxID=51811 RepID=A0ABY6L5U3_9ARAC|nr:hypothetical protein LAZ67_13001551 [Cordylochernes scorpioides]
MIIRPVPRVLGISKKILCCKCAGYMCDPEEIPGLAHFCEHMLFLGTEKYPKENEYAKYLSEHSGHFNAHTCANNTCYFFDVDPTFLDHALDRSIKFNVFVSRFAQFFLCPLFTQEATDRELNAVNSEFEKNIQLDSNRLYQLEKSTSNPKHPFHKFNCGNRSTLEKEGVREALLEFHQQWYSADIMALALLGKESLDELEQMIEPFSHIVKKNVTAPSWSDHPMGPDYVKVVFASSPLFQHHVLQASKWFLEGRQNVHDDERSGRPVTATDNAAVAAVRNVVWVPRLLSENHKQQRMEAARAFLEMHQRDGDQLFSRIVTGDESWVHHSTPETKRQSMVWKKPEESAPKKAKVTISAGKVMTIVFWDCKDVLLVDYLPPNTTVNAARYCEVLTKLRAAIKRKCSGLLSRKVLLVHDNARPHATRTTQTLLENFKWEIFTHPTYFPDLAPSDFHLFPALKLHLGGKHFANDDEVQAEANHWLRRQDTAWYNSGIKRLLQRYQKCLDRNGDYVSQTCVQPARYLGHLIGHEGPGSLLTELKARGWVNQLVAGYREGATGFGFFDVSTDLTLEGMGRLWSSDTSLLKVL